MFFLDEKLKLKIEELVSELDITRRENKLLTTLVLDICEEYVVLDNMLQRQYEISPELITLEIFEDFKFKILEKITKIQNQIQ
ncbi:hypothetical protein [Paenibacillus sp. FSL E2-0201]|uniref:hypothetical protein n=1 Tax=Paenibacillus sp. FSL E2-0201 TaxID=2954726 RepID=UPI0030DD3AE6